MWRCAMDINPSEGCPPFSLKSEITWARKWWLRIGQNGIYSLKSDCFSLPPHFMQSDCQPLWILFSKIFPGSKVWVWSQPNGAVKKDRYWMAQLYTRCVLYSQGKIYRYKSYITRNEHKDLTLCRTFVACCNVLLQHVLALLYNIIVCSSIIKAQVCDTHRLF